MMKIDEKFFKIIMLSNFNVLQFYYGVPISFFFMFRREFTIYQKLIEKCQI